MAVRAHCDAKLPTNHTVAWVGPAALVVVSAAALLIGRGAGHHRWGDDEPDDTNGDLGPAEPAQR